MTETEGGLFTPGALNAAACKVTLPVLSKIRSTTYLISNTSPGVSAATSSAYTPPGPLPVLLMDVSVYFAAPLSVAVGEFTATLSGAAKYTDTSISNTGNGPGGVYALEVAADTPGDVLDIKYVVDRIFDKTGNVTLQAAALSAPGVNNPPSVSVSHPADGANFSVNDNISITADAADADGSIVKVEFFRDDAKLGESMKSPYNLTWSNAQPGNYLLTARASDDRGATRTSAPVQVFVNGTGGALSCRGALPSNSVDGSYRIDLTVDGTDDWAHWGLSS